MPAFLADFGVEAVPERAPFLEDGVDPRLERGVEVLRPVDYLRRFYDRTARTVQATGLGAPPKRDLELGEIS